MPSLRLGFVGAGAISSRLMPHFQVADMADRAVIAAVCDPVLERAQDTVNTYGAPSARAFASLPEMLDAGVVDAVSIGSPIGLHFQHAMEAVQAGVHVHVNKTMTVTTDEADQLIETAQGNAVRIVASPGEMLRPHNLETKRLIESGAIGTLSWAACGASFGNYHQNEPERQGSDPTKNVDPSWYFRKPGGGPLYDVTVYSLHGLTGVLGPVKRVTAMSGMLIPERTVNGKPLKVEADDNTLILLDFGGNVFAVAFGAAAGSLTPGVQFDFSARYYGTEGEIWGLNLNGKPYDYPGRDLAVTAPDRGVQSNFGGNEWVLPHINAAHRHLPEQHVFEDVMQLVDWVRDDVPSVATAEHARHVIEIIEAAYTAARTGVTQSLRTSFQPVNA
jgi:predicted dehydrogenase